MKQAIAWDGTNAQEICAAITGRTDLAPYELAGGVWLKQVAQDHFQLAIPARHGEVYLEVGDYAVQEQDGAWVRLTPAQFAKESQPHAHS